jgi:outer membrane protein OmpA-like peptidoglycan-associated protein
MAGKKMSISIEHKVMQPFGRADDLIDASELASGFSPDRDLQQYTNVRLGFFLGKEEEKSKPLYWVSPLDMLAEDLAEVKARPKLDLTDSDGDGIIDMLDQEKNSPSGASVDTRGVALDSDGDGVADYQDKEPYSPPGYKVDDQGVAQVPAPEWVTEDGVNRIIDERLKDIKSSMPAPRPVEWFLPMINFGNNSYRVRQSEFGKLHNVATAMKQNPGLRVVASGHTDKTSGNCYNDKLSYNRAQAAVDYITTKYGIPRERFLINWSGENENLVPSNGSNLMNRRVEFSVATTETEMGAPDCGGGKAGSGGTNYSGNKESGY